MPRLQRKTFARPDRSRTLGAGHLEIVDLDETTVGRVHLPPGWRWSVDVLPVVGTTSCQVRHVSYALTGTLRVAMDDGICSKAMMNSARMPHRMKRSKL